jgi:hypothetical protein
VLVWWAGALALSIEFSPRPWPKRYIGSPVGHVMSFTKLAKSVAQFESNRNVRPLPILLALTSMK